jgi:hypothetical protein
LLPPLKELLAAGEELAATACACGSLDATDVTIGDGAILATIIQSDAADYFGSMDNAWRAFWVSHLAHAKLTQILPIRAPG